MGSSFFLVFLVFLYLHENIIIIGDLSETHLRPRYLIVEQKKPDMPDRTLSDTDMPNQRPTCLIGALSETHLRPRYLIVEQTETNMPGRTPIRDRHA